ncbi:MAG TPA: LysM peptidoglycan-binding domain-containing protein [Pseudomonadales bacterium]|nr:LysM peptidoglycan-binding domain-containing protein [Pseudomonadales bacterium]
MKYLIKFSTILLLVVTVTACQSPGIHNASAQAGSRPDTPETQASTDPLYNAVQIPVEVQEEDEEPASPAIPAPETEVQPPEVTNVWQRIREGMKLDHHLEQPRVQAELQWYVQHPAYLDRVATRASRYLYYIVKEIERRHLPTELALLPIVESAYDPFAYSYGRASGLWQFIPDTGKRYGLTIDYWMDGRRDIPEATNAALDYLQNLHQSLDDSWYLALAAYNSGEGNVRSSMRKNRRHHKPLDFWSLGLLPETRAYVPRLLAISALIANPARYHIHLKPIANKPYWEMVDIGSQIDLAKAAELAGISTEELYLLNPAFNRWSTRPDGPNRLLIPIDKVAEFKKNLAALPDNQRVSFKRHKVRSGENLGLIAQRYHVTVSVLKQANRLHGNMIRAGHYLLIPVAARNSQAYQLSQAQRLKTMQANAEKKYGEKPIHYTVKGGDSLWLIAQRYNVGTRALAKWNGMATTDMLMPGDNLVIFGSGSIQLASVPVPNDVIRRVNYRVHRGESLAVIADKFNLSVSDLKRWNKDVSSQKYIQPGDHITLYVDVTRTE